MTFFRLNTHTKDSQTTTMKRVVLFSSKLGGIKVGVGGAITVFLSELRYEINEHAEAGVDDGMF